MLSNRTGCRVEWDWSQEGGNNTSIVSADNAGALDHPLEDYMKPEGLDGESDVK